MTHFRIRVSLYINYFVFAILLNSVGILILRSQERYGVGELQAGNLEGFKDLSIAAVSFLVGSFLPRLGYKRGMLLALALVFAGCLAMYFGNSFGFVQLLFACVGIAFAIVKVSVYALVGLVTNSDNAHKSLLSSIESFFMIGIAAAMVLFPQFYSDTDPDAWLRIYLLLAGLIAISFVLLLTTPFNLSYQLPGSNARDDIRQMIRLLARPLVAVFALSAFMYVMTEQGIMSWLPSFNKNVLHLPEDVSIYLAVILMLSIALGRYLSSLLVKKISWIAILLFCLGGAALMVLLILPQTTSLSATPVESLADVPLIAYVFPLIGFFLAPLYPMINSFVLSASEKRLHGPMASLLVIFSALGGTLGSKLVGYLFAKIGGENAFYFSLAPMLVLVLCVVYYGSVERKLRAGKLQE
jgi:fucose permease